MHRTPGLLKGLSVLLALMPGWPASSSGLPFQAPGTERTITVQGIGTAAAETDIGLLRIELQDSATTVDSVLQLVSARADSILIALRALPVTDVRLVTTGSQVMPTLRNPHTGLPTQYKIFYKGTVKVSGTHPSREFPNTILRATPVQIVGISFESSKLTQARDRALQLAMEDGHAQAAYIAEQTGEQLGSLLHVTVTPDPSMVYRQVGMPGINGRDPLLMPDEREVTVRVSLTYLLESSN